jgi:hypothetical protein
MPPKIPTKAEQRELDARARVVEAQKIILAERTRKKPVRKVRPPSKEPN